MNYSLNIGEWNSVFAVPTSVVDKYIKLAGSNSLKLLLYLLRHGGEEIPDDRLTEQLGFTETGELEDAALFWIQRGIIKYSNENPALLSSVAEKSGDLTAEKPVEAPAKPSRKPAPVSVSSGEIAARIQDDEEIKFLFDEAERLYGRVLRQRETQMLVSLTDYYGLPGAVAAMLLVYCFKIGQTAPSYITAVAQSWAEDEIYTVELADAKIHSLEKQNAIEERLRTAMGMNSRLTSKMRNFIGVWTKEWGFDEQMIMLAYEKTVDQIKEWKPEYANKILENWKNAGTRTPEAVEAADNAHRKTGGVKIAASDNNHESSFDIGSVMSQLKNRYKNDT